MGGDEHGYPDSDDACCHRHLPFFPLVYVTPSRRRRQSDIRTARITLIRRRRPSP